jgi:hypothetical protein
MIELDQNSQQNRVRADTHQSASESSAHPTRRGRPSATASRRHNSQCSGSPSLRPTFWGTWRVAPAAVSTYPPRSPHTRLHWPINPNGSTVQTGTLQTRRPLRPGCCKAISTLVCGRNVRNNKSDVLTGHVPTGQSPRSRTCCVKRPTIELSARLSSRACLDKSLVLHEEHKECVSHLKCFIVDAAAK